MLHRYQCQLITSRCYWTHPSTSLLSNFNFGLSLKLRFKNFDTQNICKTFAIVLFGEASFHLFRELSLLATTAVARPSQQAPLCMLLLKKRVPLVLLLQLLLLLPIHVAATATVHGCRLLLSFSSCKVHASRTSSCLNPYKIHRYFFCLWRHCYCCCGYCHCCASAAAAMAAASAVAAAYVRNHKASEVIATAACLLCCHTPSPLHLALLLSLLLVLR